MRREENRSIRTYCDEGGGGKKALSSLSFSLSDTLKEEQ